MSGSVQMENTFSPENEGGMWQWMFGKNLTNIVLLNTGSSDGFVGIAAPSLARILPVCNILHFIALHTFCYIIINISYMYLFYDYTLHLFCRLI